jgi:hypothetical protein
MLGNFKFLSKNDTLDIHGNMSREVIEYFIECSHHIAMYEFTTLIATYKMIDYVYSEGIIVGGTINAYPLDAPNIRVTYMIRESVITNTIIEVDYWNTVGQLINTIREL